MITTHTWLNGTIVENSKATVPFLTSGFHYGIGVFEGIRAYDADKGAAVFRLREHLERFHGSSLILGFLEQPYSVEELDQGGQGHDQGERFRRLLHPAVSVARRWRLEPDARHRQAARSASRCGSSRCISARPRRTSA
jgi:branched-subunit amino acid aminotransferase/4-amino-4-deoxychorismate lyase